jgi:hypothetical protein
MWDDLEIELRCKIVSDLLSVFLHIRYSDCLLAIGPSGRSSSPGRVTNFLHLVQTASGAHPASYPRGTGGFFPRAKAAGA